MVDLLCGLLSPNKGEILIDNQKLLKDLTNLVSYTPQSTFLLMKPYFTILLLILINQLKK